MNSSLQLYGQILSLFAVVSLMVGFNFAVWGLHREVPSPVLSVPDANPRRGRELIQSYGCGACHVIPGVPGGIGVVGPRLDRFADQMYVAGVLPNRPENVTRWIMNPQEVSPLTAMPELGVKEDEARDITAYLYRSRQ